ncbi:Type I inositol polyphosphate 5-phosphatase 10 [Zea mays]|uniref:Type I inositol polyphosphate 5-phosphatase 10 n=1 Tax=Zea mays TaxID=4577 RepID=A0A1D6H197_MAIZE|nr:Type I inositol polyphosphate 5-phosphatase 10 [Zea mays]
MANPCVFFDMTIGGAPAGRIMMELYANEVPKTVENFCALCTSWRRPARRASRSVVMGDCADEEEAHNRCRRGRDRRQVEGGRPHAYQDEELPGLAGYAWGPRILGLGGGFPLRIWWRPWKTGGRLLNIQRASRSVFKGWSEEKIYFAPTYKYSCNSYSYAGETATSKKKRRTPAWCDRILWHGDGIAQLSYFRGESQFSYHRPVCGTFTVEMDEIVDKAISIMQVTSKHLMYIRKEKLHSGKALSAIEVKELREALEAIAEGLDQDSLLCQSLA